MSATRMIFGWGDEWQTELATDGYAASVAPGPAAVGPGFSASLNADWDLQSMSEDADEAEFEFRHRVEPGLRLVLRHAFSVVWGVRFAFTNTGSEPIQVEHATWRIDAAPGCVGWGLAAGAEASFSVQSDSGVTGLLGASLQIGAAYDLAGGNLEFGPFDLEPGARYVVQWLIDSYPRPLAFGRERHPMIPHPLILPLGTPCPVADDDTAVITPDSLTVLEPPTAEPYAMPKTGLVAGQQRELISERVGCFPIELRSVRGATTFTVQWVSTLGDAISASADEVLNEPRSSAGVVRLRTVDQALVLQRALAGSMITTPEDAEDALDLFAVGVGDTGIAGPREVVFLAREYIRGGDADLLALAEEAFGSIEHNGPGVGLAATQLSLALLLAGHSTEPVLRRLPQLADDLRLDGGEDNLSDRIAALELDLVSQRASTQTSGLVAALGVYLGSGLPGSAFYPIAAPELARVITVFELLPDAMGQFFDASWGLIPAQLAEQAVSVLLSESDRDTLTAALAWLTMGQTV